MCICAEREWDNLLPDLITTEVWQDIDPYDIIYSASEEAGSFISPLFSLAVPESNEGWTECLTYIPMPTTQYVPYQKLTSPPLAPPAGGYQGITRMNTDTAK